MVENQSEQLASSFFNGLTLGCCYPWMAWIFPIPAGSMIKDFGGIPHTATAISAIDVIGLVVPRFLPETKVRPLPDRSGGIISPFLRGTNPLSTAR